jgi:hypothetical protein
VHWGTAAGSKATSVSIQLPQGGRRLREVLLLLNDVLPLAVSAYLDVRVWPAALSGSKTGDGPSNKEVVVTTAYEPSAWDAWNYSQSSGIAAGSGFSLVDYDVEATDGGIGKIDEATDDVGASYVVVDTGPWIFGKKVMLPAGTIGRVDSAERKVYVDQTRDQIKNAPEFDKDTYTGLEYRDRLSDYYGRTTRDYHGRTAL